MKKEEQFEHIENKIKAAAENFQPVFNEQAWVKMEAMLDNEKKRKPFLWLWFLFFILLIGGPGYLLLKNFTSPKNNTSKNDVIKTLNQKNDNKVKPLIAEEVNPLNNTSTHLSNSPKNFTTFYEVDNRKYNPSHKLSTSKKQNIVLGNPGLVIDTADLSRNNIIPEDRLWEINTGQNSLFKPTDAGKINDSFPANEKQALKSSSDTSKKIDNKVRSKEYKNNHNFYIVATAGPDIGSVKLPGFKNSSFSLKYGLSVGYKVSNKIAIQTGLFISRKKYQADPADYHIKEGSYWTIVRLTNVDANCLVYEIPLSARYEFITKPVTSYYATGGLSSYIMKKEDYNYSYLRNNLPEKSAKSYTGNQNLFSILTLSGGVERKINKSISILAEPSLAIPLSGVGEGKVKIFSSTIQIGLKYHPIKKH